MFVQKLDDSFVSSYKHALPPWGPVGYVTYKRTYARKLCSCSERCDHPIEEWWMTLRRCVEAICRAGAFTKDDAETLYDYCFRLKCLFAGRHLWQLGTPAVDRIGADSLQNCWFVAADSLRAFEFAMDQLMLGGGVGMSVRAEDVHQLPVVKHSPEVRRFDEVDVDFIVPDNREGWVHLLHKVFKAFFHSGKRLTYSVHCLRARGKLIKTFGGTASGGEVLVEGIDMICRILRQAHGRRLTTVEAGDIFNVIGHIVVAGNVRRSAEILIGDAGDLKFLDMKKWQKGHVPAWRARSNNSVACDSISDLPDSFWDNYNGEGEPVGLVNLRLLRSCGRLADGTGYRTDPRVKGVNPCGEIGLEPFESCNLFEQFLPNLSDAEFYRTTELGIKVCKSISVIHHAQPETCAVVERNHRLGVGITGFLQALDKHRESLFNGVYRHAEEVDRSYSKLLGVGESIKLTTVKPSGTLSLLPGVTPGVHAAIAQHWIRRIQFSSDDRLVEACRERGYHVEPRLNIDGSHDLRTMVVEFPSSAPVGTVLEEELTAVQQLDCAAWLQENWSDNSVSCTVSYSEHELPSIRAWLAKNYDARVKAISFLLRGTASGFKQMPYEEISKEEFDAISKHVRPIVDGVQTLGTMSNQECVGGSCPVR